MSEDRRDILLKAAYDILKVCDQGIYVRNVLVMTAEWDGLKKNGSCLMDEIAELLIIDENCR